MDIEKDSPYMFDVIQKAAIYTTRIVQNLPHPSVISTRQETAITRTQQVRKRNRKKKISFPAKEAALDTAGVSDVSSPLKNNIWIVFQRDCFLLPLLHSASKHTHTHTCQPAPYLGLSQAKCYMCSSTQRPVLRPKGIQRLHSPNTL